MMQTVPGATWKASVVHFFQGTAQGMVEMVDRSTDVKGTRETAGRQKTKLGEQNQASQKIAEEFSLHL